MTKPIYDADDQVRYLKERFDLFMEVLDNLEPENTKVEDIDRLIEMIDSIEEKFVSFQNRPDQEPE